jgi:ribosomal protein S18 acetylase RimI-like enzyme
MTQIIEANLALPEHAQALVQLMNEYALDPMGGGEALPDSVQSKLAAELQKRSNVRVVLAFVENQPAGLAVCMEGFSTFACKPLLNIHDMVVSREFRGRGLASKLLKKAEDIAIELGCCKITLEVLEGNRVAQAAYRSAGFAGYELDPSMGKAMFWQKKL